jgi:SET domain-containing protein
MIMHSYISAKVKVVISSVDRRGVFALKPIKKGEVVSVYGGHIITQKEYNKLAKSCFRHIHDYAIKVADGFYLVSSKGGRLEDDDFFNHSCDPNVGIKGHLLMVAIRDIRPKEELTYDYSMTDADMDYAFKCNCQSPKCRKLVSGSDWLKPAIQRKYRGFFSWFVQDKIDRSKSRRSRRN